MDEKGIPLGFGMALSQNQKALEKFSLLDEAAKNDYINKARGVSSKSEMRSLAEDIANTGTSG